MSLRPSLLDPLFAPATVLPGAGPKVAVLIDKLVGTPERPARVVDLLFHLPQRGIARQLRGSIAEAPPGEPVTLGVTVVAHRPPQTAGRKPFRVLVEDQTGDITLVFFNLPRARIEKMLPLGSHRYVSGRIELWDGFRQMVHPSRILDEKGLADLPAVEPIYGATEGLTSRAIGKLAVSALDRLPVLPEWQDRAFLDRQGWPAFADALRTEHRPAEAAETEEDLKTPARRRLAYDELLASQLALALVRSRMHRPPGRTNVGDGALSRRIEAALPFGLTGAQTRALAEIRGDMGSDRRMLRLLQGDVGSGKTAVALLAMASAIEAGRQAAMMAPTEILARQHAERLRPLVETAGLRLALLTGRDRAAERRATLAGLADGSIHVVVGTHALFQDDVAFHDLGLAVVDEQHRFGVHQRLALGAKGAAVDVLVMTATPIPRTLALTCFGDMEVSVLDEKPAGRQPIKTVLVSTDRLEEVTLGLERALAKGDRVYWICPLVAESEYVDLAAAEERFSALRERFGEAVGLVHGKMAGKDKDEAMERFVAGETKILVSTTVVEVGVDVPAATVMVIEHAERFGLAQLHQLRGRVGRGSGASTCLLLFKGPLGQVARARLEMMRETEDGFRIAEEDLRLRGEGEVLGTRQSGLAAFRLARPEVDGDLIVAARDDAKLVVERDPGLKSERGQALRALLYLFERDAAVKLLQAG
ncbi:MULTISPECIES: ATP-dependent DNA helicase RecG [Methylobacterium]|jgi:ATP-dependent DNA helicase RecG|uniref:ATP-dependent DNA helicase RecG n=1 Tax=Methylobacterium TaxID=407 RepID=UPI0008EC4C33|nr:MULTISPECIES: ATP-dependent DNA helicase RecG [Methylobacterium]MBZ6412405.1 ATP-dependent DNA helicase RecG [Methylobacterium sp.]MBK3396490.1 ATP-dependent DNA helicase RecG [Methylobacterium ajmalii]MBK3407830.1 ATP-dependent DNA helicase RecG [Methylobacterium ajmalii]MBK3424823.1 ATP-dependent DNA helicase RecG [Methylobacterium ajmalii]SFE28902.1 ATP-dependent DNA helicase RecG [Methylobacterium sp. yr596]